MKLNILKAFTIVFFGLLITTGKVSANTARPSAVLISDSNIKPADKRAETLRIYLESYNSPLASYANTFIEEADRNNLDWKLVVSIAGNESQYGQMIPPESYNAWGFGVYGTNVRYFSSWDEGIAVVSKALRTEYMNQRGATNVYEIGSTYAEDPLWANKVMFYMNKLEDFNNQAPNSTLSISL